MPNKTCYIIFFPQHFNELNLICVPDVFNSLGIKQRNNPFSFLFFSFFFLLNAKKQSGNKINPSVVQMSFNSLKTAETVWKNPPFFLAVFLTPAPPLLASMEQKSDILMNQSFSFFL